MEFTQLPEGFSFEKRRSGLTAVKDEAGQYLFYALHEEAALKALGCLERFGGVVGNSKAADSYVEL